MSDSILLIRLGELNPDLHTRVKEVRDAARVKTARIVEIFPHYTSHDTTHADKTLEICAWLAGTELIKQLNAPELFVLISSVYLHDVGMALDPKTREDIERTDDYKTFAKESGLSEKEALAEWIRRDHHIKSADLIRTTYSAEDGVGIRDKGLAFATALVCESHGTDDLNDFIKYDPYYAWGTSGETIRLPLLAVLLRLSDYLHVTSDRTPLSVLPLLGLFGSVSKQEWAKHLSTVGIAPKGDNTVRISCICDSPDVHRSILQLCDFINEELAFSHQILRLLENEKDECYQLNYNHIEPNIQADGYEPWVDLTFNLNRGNILRLLTGERLYEDPGAPIKELIMNAVDATRQNKLLTGELMPIKIELNSMSKQFSIIDHGIGMNKHDIENFLLELGKCFYRSKEYGQEYKQAQRIETLSEFGIGFASCFLAAEHVALETCKPGDTPIMLDMYDLLGFVAARRGTMKQTGTKITLHLKADAVESVINCVKSLASIFPHLEMPLLINLDGEEFEVSSQTFCYEPDDLLAEFYKGKEDNIFIEHKHLDAEDESVTGCISIIFENKNGVMSPGCGTTFFYKQEKDLNRRFSQLGMKLPEPQQQWPEGIFKELNNTTIGYDLDLKGGMRLELDPSRTKVLPSPKNRQTIERLDALFVDFIMELHEKHWKNLKRDQIFDVYLSLSKIIPFWNRSSFILFKTSIIPLIDLFLKNVPLEIYIKGGTTTRKSWSEIQASNRPVVFFKDFKQLSDREGRLNDVCSAIPDALLIIEEASYPLSSFFTYSCDTKSIYISDYCKLAFPVYRPWQGTAIELKDKKLASIKKQIFWSFIIPFMPTNPYAIVSSTATRRGGACACWINSVHPKIVGFMNAISDGERRSLPMKACKKFLLFIHEKHIGFKVDNEYVEYIQQHQRTALDELISHKILSAKEADKLSLVIEDFVPWEGDW